MSAAALLDYYKGNQVWLYYQCQCSKLHLGLPMAMLSQLQCSVTNVLGYKSKVELRQLVVSGSTRMVPQAMRFNLSFPFPCRNYLLCRNTSAQGMV
jgi:hypothetical protein